MIDNREPIEKKKGKPIKIINQGTYGCIFKPGLTCEGMIDESKKDITKVQRKKETSENEVNISKKIMEIKGYNRYFAPITESCDVDISNIMNDEFRKCKFIEENEKSKKELQFEINKIPYIGGETLSTYYFNLLEKKGAMEFATKFINGYKTLIEGAKKMSAMGVIHYDIKENNIMCRKQSGRPIYIDFGLSFDVNELSLEDDSYFDVFYVFEQNYPPWCFDINMICYLLNNIGADMETVKEIVNLPVSDAQIKEFFSIYFTENDTLNSILSKEEQESMIVSFIEYMKKLQERGVFTSIKWKKVVEEMLKYNNTWDVYAVNICYLLMFNDLSLEKVIAEVPFMNTFKQMLKEAVMMRPDKRPDAKACLNGLKKVTAVPKKEIENLKESIEKIRENKEEISNRKKVYVDSKMKYGLERI
tara:strand:+ start:3684 stop:4937 length:1254 start_codon:yes stop_codon:yes gene_type:complete